MLLVQNPPSGRNLHIPPEAHAHIWLPTRPQTCRLVLIWTPLPQLWLRKAPLHGGPQGSRMGPTRVPRWPRHTPSEKEL